MLPALALGALSFGGSLLQGLGAKQASAKQARMQMIADGMAREANERTLAEVNAKREQLGRELLTIPEVTGSWVDVDGMMAAAERSGFNPVTWLQAGGMSAYQQTWRTGHNAADAFKLMVPEYALAQASQVPQQHSALSAFGGALSAGASAFGTQFRADMSYDLQAQKLAQAESMMGFGLSGRNGLMTAINYGGTGGSSARVGAGAVRGLSTAISDLPYPEKWKAGDVEVTNPWGRAFIDHTVSNADTKETRYGEPGDWLFGVDTMIHDAARNLSGRTIREWGQKVGLNIGDYKQKGDTSWSPAFGRWWNSPTSLPNTFLRSPFSQQQYNSGNTPLLFPGAAAY